MRVLGVVGWSGSGKTTLIAGLLPVLIGRGLRVSTIKHAHHGFDLDQPGKDSHRHRLAGAHEVLVASADRWALLHEAPPPVVHDMLARLAPVDLVLIEGFHAAVLPQIEVYRPQVGKPAMWPTLPDVRAVASDANLPASAPLRLDLNDPVAIADWVLRTLPMLQCGA